MLTMTLNMRLLYSIFLYLIAPLVLMKLFLNSLRHADYRSRIAERFGKISCRQNNKPVLWLHAVSVGETQAAKPLVNRLIKLYPAHHIVLTTITPSGAATVKQVFGDAVEHLYLPYDLPHAVNNFIHAVKPRLLVIMETEIWPNLIYYCQQHGVKTALVNARVSDKSFCGYKKAGALIKRTLGLFDLLVAQTRLDAQRLEELGAKPERIFTTNNLKFDITVASSLYEQGQSMRRFFSIDRPVFIAASSHAGEEEQILQAFKQIRVAVPECLLLLAPRHPDRTAAVENLITAQGFTMLLRSHLNDYGKDTQVILINTLGELLLFYACSDVAFVGGSLVPLGGHNLLEPAAVGLPVLSGRHVNNFREIADMLLAEQALLFIDNSVELAEHVIALVHDANRRHDYGQRAKQFVQKNQGSTARTLQLLEEFIVC